MVWCRERLEEDARDGEQTRGRKIRKKEGFPASFISAVLPFTCYCKMKTCQKRNRIFLVYIFRKIAHFMKKLHLCKGTELVFFFFFLLWKNALVNDKTNKAREVNKRGRTRYPLRWAAQNGQSFGFLKQLKRLRNGQKLEKEMVCSQQDRAS